MSYRVMMVVAWVLEAVAAALLAVDIFVVGFRGPFWVSFGAFSAAVLGFGFAVGASTYD